MSFLEHQRKTSAKKEEFFFDFEIALRDPAKQKEHTTHFEEKIQQLKQKLREGSKQEYYAVYSTLLTGYESLKKVMEKISRKKSTPFSS